MNHIQDEKMSHAEQLKERALKNPKMLFGVNGVKIQQEMTRLLFLLLKESGPIKHSTVCLKLLQQVEVEERRGSVSTNVPIMDGSPGLPWHQYTRSAAWRGPACSPHSRVIIFIPAISQIEMDTYDKSVRASVGDRTF